MQILLSRVSGVEVAAARRRVYTQESCHLAILNTRLDPTPCILPHLQRQVNGTMLTRSADKFALLIIP